jgi:hypothetical protein
VAVWGLARKAVGPSVPPEPSQSRPSLWRRIVDALGQAVFLNAVAIGGLLRYLRGDRLTQWPVVRRPKSG